MSPPYNCSSAERSFDLSELIVTRASSKAWIPELIAAAGSELTETYIDFFTSTIRNRNTRAAYARACWQFFDWCAAHDPELTTVRPFQSGKRRPQSEIFADRFSSPLSAATILISPIKRRSRSSEVLRSWWVFTASAVVSPGRFAPLTKADFRRSQLMYVMCLRRPRA
jgi:hypothetical protein